jgi:four helix bundle protein
LHLLFNFHLNPPPTPKTAQPHHFDHEKLAVYGKSLDFAAWVTNILDRVPKSLSVWNQLDRASTSIPLNIAEGTGKFTIRDKCRYYDSARGSALESAACLDVLVVKKILSVEEVSPGKELLHPIVAMLVGLIRTIAPRRVYGPYSRERLGGECK